MHPGAVGRIKKLQAGLNQDHLPEQQRIYFDEAGTPVGEGELQPTITSAFRLSDLQGQSALDLMNQKMEGKTVGNLPQLPLELVGKTIA
jgi:hypothetical protein